MIRLPFPGGKQRTCAPFVPLPRGCPHHVPLPPALRGKITVTEGVDTVTAGLLVFVDDDKNGSWDIPATGHLEIHGVTDTLGEFRIPALPKGTHQIKIIVPPDYTLLSNNQPVEFLPIEYNGAPLELKLKLQPNRGLPQ